jgi:hypothetical protein
LRNEETKNFEPQEKSLLTFDSDNDVPNLAEQPA